MKPSDKERDMVRTILTTLAVIIFFCLAIASRAHAETPVTAPPAPDSYKAPAKLVSAVEDRLCASRDCDDALREGLRAKIARYHWVGQWYVENHNLPTYMAWWLPAQCLRESGCGMVNVGDGGASLGDFHVQEWVESFWKRTTGRVIDRTQDHDEVARALLHAVSNSYHKRVTKVCGKQSSRFDQVRMAAARVGRGPKARSGRPRCDFMVWHKSVGAWKETAGVTVMWSKKWFDAASKTAGG